MTKSSKSPGTNVELADQSAENSSGTDSMAGELMQSMLSRPSRVSAENSDGRERIPGIVIGTVTAVSAKGRVQVEIAHSSPSYCLDAISTMPLSRTDVGREAALSFIEGDPKRPVILGLIENPAPADAIEANERVDVRVDEERLTFTAEKEIVLRCGKSSITLTRAGKIIIKGEYLSNHSTGVNRIKGGSVQIN